MMLYEGWYSLLCIILYKDRDGSKYTILYEGWDGLKYTILYEGQNGIRYA